MRLWMLAGLMAAMSSATIVDGIAVSVGTKVIAISEIALRIRLTAFENGVQPVFDGASRKRSVEQLIDQRLVEREMDVGHYPRLTPEAQAALLPEYAKAFFHSDMAGLNTALRAHGLTAADLADDLARQNDLLTFLNLRFRPAVQGSEQEEEVINKRADADMEMWLREQRKRTRIEYLDRGLAP